MSNQPDIIHRQLSDPSTWMHHYRDYLLGYAYRRVADRGLAEDVVQETFLAALDARDRFAGNCSEKTWLVAILKRKIVDRIRERQGQYSVGFDTEWDALEADFDPAGAWTTRSNDWSDPELAAQSVEFRRVVVRCLARLPPPISNAFALRELYGASSKDTCNVLGISSTNLRVIVHRARARLQRCLEALWFGQSRREPK